MSRRRKYETPAHRKERHRQRLRAAEKRRTWGRFRRWIAGALYSSYRQQKGVRAIWWHIPSSWAHRLRKGKTL